MKDFCVAIFFALLGSMIMGINAMQDHQYAYSCREVVRTCCDSNDFAKGREVLNNLICSGPLELDDAFACGNLLLQVGDVQGAIALFTFLHEQYPQSASIWYNVAYASKIAGNTTGAINILEQIIAQKPDCEDAQFSLGHTYLVQGDFMKGWKQHDRFLRRTNRYAPVLREWIETNQLAGKRILVRPEGGFGDTIQFFRCARWLKEQGAVVYAVVQRSLFQLFKQCPYIDQLIKNGDALPPYDATTTFMTLPALYNADEIKMGEGIPYLTTDIALEEEWRQSLAVDRQFKIGICWQADVHNDVSRLPMARRGIPLKKLLRVANIPGISLYSLQKREGLEQVDDSVRQIVHFFDDDFDESHGSFVDTAAVMKQMDLIISVDSAVAHVAGATAVPVFLLLPYFTDWRWIMGRVDSPWYPTMQIFKQPAPFDWDSVIDQLMRAICLLVNK